MSVIAGTITGVTLVRAPVPGGGARKSYLCTVNFAAYTGASDTASVAGVGAAIAAFVKNGKTNTLCAGALPVCVNPGQDTAGQDVYIGTTTLSVADITFSLVDAANSEVTSTTGVTTGVEIVVPVVES